jgi:hypothetical protein
VAEFLASHGYSTAGFVANFSYCGSDSGLNRGFAAYRDYSFPRLSVLNRSALVDRPLEGLQSIEDFLENRFDRDVFAPAIQWLWWNIKTNRKEAAVVNHEILESQVHVPLVIVPPAGDATPRVVSETVSLRDLAATIAEIPDLKTAAPFPGDSLARFWKGPVSESSAAVDANQTLSEVVPLDSFGSDPSQWPYRARWPLAALTLGEWVYIRREGNVQEELYGVRDHIPGRQNLASDPAMQPTLERMRGALGRLTGGPLTPERFNP